MHRTGLLFYFLLLVVFGSFGSLAEEISRYHTRIKVLPSGALEVQEDILYDFGAQAKHGIFRDIPLMIKADKYAKETSVGISDISTLLDSKAVQYTNRTLSSKTAGEILRLKIGDPAHTLTGKHLYTISYKVFRGVYPSAYKGMEAIRWNAVGSGSNIPTKEAVAEMILPSPLGRDNVLPATYTGRYGSKITRGDYQWIDDRRIRYAVAGLSPHEAFTIEANFPKGLLGQSADDLQSSFEDRLIGTWHWAGIAAFLLFLWNYAKKFGVNDNVGAVAVQYYPPKGLSLLQSGLIIDKFADKKDFAAAVLELGSLGYLKIDDVTKPPVIQKSSKNTQSSELSLDQKYILEGILFDRGSQYVLKPDDPYKSQRLQEKLDRLNRILYDWSVASGQMRIDPQKSRSRFLMTSVTISAILVALSILSMLKLYGIDIIIPLLMGVIFVGVGFFVLITSLQKRAWSGIFFGLFWLATTIFGFGSTISQMPNLPALLTSPIMVLPVVAVTLWYFYRKIGIFTQKGLDTYRYLLGYKDFITRVEKERIKRFLREDPLYLDKNLPYAVLFGVSKHWLKLYNELSVDQPVWYYGDIGHMDSFSRSLQSQAMPQVSESGGFSGGGGFAGGGGGGGGVGSW